ncbi:MAG: DnaJ domain-containing protein [Kofleriaceae bacterium]|nr:DnaJ domain-containing protein [Kofleriaceae bacterium]
MPTKRKQMWSRREVLSYLDRILPALDKLDHFEILDVSYQADTKEIQSAFHSMAARLHPDRHRNGLTPEQYEKLVIAYARIAEAYRILRDPKHRDGYVAKLRKGRDASAKAAPKADTTTAALALLSPKAQQLYRRATAAARTGDRSSAILNLRMALSKHPQSDFLKNALRNLQKPR